MRPALRSLAAGAISIALIASSAPASASVLDTYQGLAERHLSPAPLVPTTAPPSLAPLDRTVTSSTSLRRSGYGIRLVHYGSQGPDAVIALEGGSFKTLKAALGDGKRSGFKARSTRIRGHSGYLLTRRLGPTSRSLLWVENGRVYSIGSGTPKKVSLRQLRATAGGLDPIGNHYLGSGGDPDNPSEAQVVTTAHTVSASVDWGAQCLSPGATATTPRVGRANAALLARRGDAFTFDIAQHRVGEGAWNGTVSATIAPNAVTINVRATATVDGQSCDSGAQTFSVPRT
jgi:hypothetical protein